MWMSSLFRAFPQWEGEKVHLSSNLHTVLISTLIRFIYDEVILPLVDEWKRPAVFETLREHLLVFKPEVKFATFILRVSFLMILLL